MDPVLQAALDNLTAQVTKTEGAEASASKAIVGLAALYAANKTNPAAIQALSDRLTASESPLDVAIAANPLPA